MDLHEKVILVMCTIGVLIIFAVVSLVFFMPHTFEGYYLSYGHIDASYKWMPDETAFDYTPEMWQTILDNNLQLEPTK